MMHEHVSRILDIGIVNSGMFDLIKVNTDVQAIHLVGDNNVGKTSLIQIIQFLYFPYLHEMRFSKPLPDTLGFYFRRAGSYILFHVRTLTGVRRTVGIYGEGPADTRVAFVFNGEFELDDFLDDQQCVVPLSKLQPRLFARGFRRFEKWEQYERALVGDLADGNLNVQLFDLSLPNFRLLRQLLQGLLRLDKLAARDAQDFIITVVESGGIKTRVNIMQDFQRKTQEIKVTEQKLADLQQLAPIIQQWLTLTQQLTNCQSQQHDAEVRLYVLTWRYLRYLTEQVEALQTQHDINVAHQKHLSEVQTQLIQQQAGLVNRLDELSKSAREYEHLLQTTASLIKEQVTARRNELIAQQHTLTTAIAQLSGEKAERLRQQVGQATKNVARLLRQREQRTIEHLLQEAQLTDEQLALLSFLFAQGFLGLPVATFVDDPSHVVHAAREAVAQVAADGTFTGFGLHIPRNEWYTSREEQETLEERLSAAQRAKEEAEQKLAIVEHRERQEQELAALRQHINEQDALLRKIERVAELQAQYGSLDACRRQEDQLRQKIERKTEAISQAQRDVQESTGRLNASFATLNEWRKQRDAVQAQYERMMPRDVDQHAIDQVPEEDLASKVSESEKELENVKTQIERILLDLDVPRSQLVARHEREAPSTPFTTWVDDKSSIMTQIANVEGQLRDHYDYLLTLVRSELSKLDQAFEIVRQQITELNNLIRRTPISNIERVEVRVKESELVEAIRKASSLQLDMFSASESNLTFDDARSLLDDYLLPRLSKYGQEIALADMFTLEFGVWFAEATEPQTTKEIHQFESNGTATGIKIVLYLGLIKLLEGTRRAMSTRIPFFLDEVGTISSNNLRHIIGYCEAHNFLPIFASPHIRNDISHNYILKRRGDRSELTGEVVLTPRTVNQSHATTNVDNASP